MTGSARNCVLVFFDFGLRQLSGDAAVSYICIVLIYLLESVHKCQYW